ncbi:hypothetical protein [Polaribacter sp. KT25b]|uniref:hypothetical protein n=1 Tax=Polaribacter sp. KT25b TaxID=1855336 RepID=UPI000B869E46|nr:hypothetical protein [Polaribacter sp. KT25b]
MKYKIIIRKILRIIGSIAIVFLTIFTIHQFKASRLAYGKKSNEIRKSINLPIIKPLMYSQDVNNDLLGNRWVSFRKEPKKGEVLHIWKLAIPEDDNETLHEERDAFRKMDENEIVYQLNLFSTIENGNIMEQEAILFEVSSSYEDRKTISGIELKNLIAEWKILELK